MSPKIAIALTSAACAVAVQAQPVLPGYDFVKGSVSYAGGMDLDDNKGSLDIFQAEARTVLSGPLQPFEDFTILPVIQYKYTNLDFGDSTGIGSLDLHSISLSSFLVYSQKSSPWIFGGWVRAEVASDFDHYHGDALSFDVVAGAAYKFSDNLTVGLGVAGINLNNANEYYFGPAVDWKINDCLHFGLLGPNAVLTWTFAEDWELSLRGDASGDEWNVDAGGSGIIDLDTYRVGLFVDRRLTGDLWLRVGAGATVANSITAETSSGDWINREEMDQGYFGEISVRLATW